MTDSVQGGPAAGPQRESPDEQLRGPHVSEYPERHRHFPSAIREGLAITNPVVVGERGDSGLFHKQSRISPFPVPVVGGTQWIAWDAIDKQIRSWSLYSGGGFGEAVWTKDGNEWAVKTMARSADGRKVR